MIDDHKIDVDRLMDHAAEEHQEMSRRVGAAWDAERERDPQFCTHCAVIGLHIAKVVQFQYLVDIGSEHEKAEYQPMLDIALRERMALPGHSKETGRRQ